MFSNMSVSTNEIGHLFPKIKLTPEVLRWDSIFAAKYADQVFSVFPLFKNTRFNLLNASLASTRQITGCEEQYKQTSQPYLDYHVIFKDPKTGITIKYSNLKLGDYKPFSGHLVLAYNEASYNMMSKVLLDKHIQYFSTDYKNPFFPTKLKQIYKEPINWPEKNEA